MTEWLVKEKEIVVPGEKLVTGMDALPGIGTYREGDSIYAGRLGLTYLDGRTIKLIPLSGRYSPKKDDVIVGKVFNIGMYGWNIDTNSAYPAVLNLKEASADFIPKGADLTRYYSIGDYLVCQVFNVTSQKLIDVSMRGPGLVKLTGGRVIAVSPQKVPRIIGKQGSMVMLLKQASSCLITVGQNGLVWIKGEPSMEFLVERAIRMIEEQSHISGLTEAVSAFLEAETGKKLA
ncbi:RNA-binding protein [Candidatus Woesearchaeota archaeon]|nr:RNA-binding protein [Candidatus Woesearchaeota archaeon]